MVRKRTSADDADMLAVPSPRPYHLRLRILTGLVASALVVLLAAAQGIRWA
jgi:hypothetical protein